MCHFLDVLDNVLYAFNATNIAVKAFTVQDRACGLERSDKHACAQTSLLFEIYEHSTSPTRTFWSAVSKTSRDDVSRRRCRQPANFSSLA